MYADHLLSLGLTVSCLWSIICRINQMGDETPHSVFFKYAVLAMGLFISLFTVSDQNLWLLAGISGYLLLSAHRWRDGVPASLRIKTVDGHRPRNRLERAWHWFLTH